MRTFGQLLRIYRRQCQDPERGGLLTQDRLGELLGVALGDAGYSGAAVSDWERDKSKINEDDRLVLVNLIKVLHQCEGLETPAEANELLGAGNYRDLDSDESRSVFSDAFTGSGVENAQSSFSGSESIQMPSSSIARAEQPEISFITKETESEAHIGQPRRKQMILLDKVNHFWVEGVLEHSVRDGSLIDLKWRSRDESIEQPWAEIVSSAAYDNLDVTDATSIGSVFENTDRALLILGDPGAGKTTILLILAKDLIARARKDQSQPIPVVLNLVSWEATRRPLADWIEDELTAKYQIPRQLGRSWLESDQLVLLLDGFDEVRDRRRLECAEEINRFRETHGLTGIAVCSRTERYEASSINLKLGAAILLEPLTSDQVDEYLVAAGPRLVALRATIQKDRSLQEMTHSPLMLSVMGAAYSDVSGIQVIHESKSSINVRTQDKIEYERGLDQNRRRRLFDAYVRKMFERYGGDPAYPSRRTEMYLSWLARKLPQHNMSLFLIEQMQPSWLPTLRWRRTYILSHGLIVGFVAGIILWLFLALIEQRNSQLATGLFGPIADYVAIPSGTVIFLFLVFGNILLGLVSSAISGFYMERYDRSELEGSDEDRLKWQRIGITGLIIGLLTVIVLLPMGRPQLAFSWGFAESVVYVIVARYVHGQSFDRDIRVVESISWSWHHALEGVLVGLVVGIITELLGARMAEGVITGITTSVFVLGAFLLGGMRGRRVEEKSRPNEGILLSLRNAVVAALFMGPVLGVLVLIYYDWIAGLITAVIMVLIVFSLFGGSTVTKHLLLRLILRREGCTPWRYARFLDHTSRLVFLRKVGGGYIFLHRYLQEYFAGLQRARPDLPLQDELKPSFIVQDTLPDAQP
ncbi:MAG: NACHT domain-containing protein [Candidatus Promineifilaceae bacterium]